MSERSLARLLLTLYFAASSQKGGNFKVFAWLDPLSAR